MEVRCQFNKSFDDCYTCFVNSISITKPKTEIKSFKGDHEQGKDEFDVEAISFINTKVHFNLYKSFPNLKALKIENCELKEITRDDLAGLKNISKLGLNKNQLKSLPDDLFEGMKNLQWIRFNDNFIEYASSKLIRSVLGNKLVWVDFRNNLTINAAYNSRVTNPEKPLTSLQGVLDILDEQCKLPQSSTSSEEKFATGLKKPSMQDFNAKLARGFKNFWGSKQLSDFVINVGAQKFPVHKFVLMIQSEYFAEIFSKQSVSTNKLTIEDLSADAVEEVLRWMYTGQFPDAKHAVEAYALSVKLKMPYLREIAENFVLRNLNQEIAMDIFELGHRYGSYKLKSSAFEEIKKFLSKPDLSKKYMDDTKELRIMFNDKKKRNELKMLFKDL